MATESPPTLWDEDTCARTQPWSCLPDRRLHFAVVQAALLLRTAAHTANGYTPVIACVPPIALIVRCSLYDRVELVPSVPPSDTTISFPPESSAGTYIQRKSHIQLDEGFLSQQTSPNRGAVLHYFGFHGKKDRQPSLVKYFCLHTSAVRVDIDGRDNTAKDWLVLHAGAIQIQLTAKYIALQNESSC